MKKEQLIKEITKKVLEAIHGIPYEEAVIKEGKINGQQLVCFGIPVIEDVMYEERASSHPLSRGFPTGKVVTVKECTGEYTYSDDFFVENKPSIESRVGIRIKPLPFPITIGRVMQAFAKKEMRVIEFDCWTETFMKNKLNYCSWQLTKENGEECTLEDQSIETLKELNQLLTNK